jgi:2OG-Fe(II) oxygenase superfamily
MITIENFVLQQDNFFSQEECESFIELYHKMESFGLTINRQKSEGADGTVKKDDQMFLTEIVCKLPTSDLNVYGFPQFWNFSQKFWENIYPAYASEYSALNGFEKMTIRLTKVQKTEVGGGYHVWHCENGTVENMRRVAAFIVYLNDVEEGGETEFLYYPKRVRAKQGRLILWPSGFTHVHRGNPPISETKYIFTGWIEIA